MVLLLTGFEALNRTGNASEIVVKSLRDSITPELSQYQERLRFEILPGDTNAIAAFLAEKLRQYAPEYVLLTGQAPGRNQITFEQIAKNLKNFRTPDRVGNLPTNERIVQDGTVSYWSTVPGLEGLVSLLEANRIPAALSSDAGTHLCNQVLYQTLQLSQNTPIKVGFIHIPILPEQVIQDFPDSPFMPIEMTRRALSLTIEQLIRQNT